MILKKEFISKCQQLDGVYIEYDNYYYDIRKKQDIKRLSNRKNIKEDLEEAEEIKIENNYTTIVIVMPHVNVYIHVGSDPQVEKYFNLLENNSEKILAHRYRNKIKCEKQYLKKLLTLLKDIDKLKHFLLTSDFSSIYCKGRDYIIIVENNNYKDFINELINYSGTLLLQINTYNAYALEKYFNVLRNYFSKDIIDQKLKDKLCNILYDEYKDKEWLFHKIQSKKIKKFIVEYSNELHAKLLVEELAK
jgi:hypothetical protein